MKKKTIKCILCGRSSPKPYGECFCSYDLVFLTENYKKINQKLAKLVKHFIKIR